MTHVVRILLALVLLAWRPLLAQELTEATYASTRDHVLPGIEEERWRKIPWRATLWRAIAEARRLDKPVLLWAMNGHPLGCT